MTTYHAHGKLLISGEYFITKGSKGLALPLTRMKQSLVIEKINQNFIEWKSMDMNQDIWFEARFELPSLKILFATNKAIANRTREILLYIKDQVPDYFTEGFKAITSMNFSPSWGLGSSSTFITLLAEWSGLNPFELQFKFFKGSGYDIACAKEKSPLIYSMEDGKPHYVPVNWNPPFKNKLHFIYQGKKKDSREAMKEFSNSIGPTFSEDSKAINELTKLMVSSETLKGFMKLMDEHEKVISRYLSLKPLKENYFTDFNGSIKSLGGWGGDFFLAASSEDDESVKKYFTEKGLDPCLKWQDLIE